MIRLVLIVAAIASPVMAEEPTPREQAAGRAIAFLQSAAAEWRGENGCFACHHQGDVVRALEHARLAGYRIDRDALAQSIDWLHQPDEWKHNGGEEFSDPRLATIQFAAALDVVGRESSRSRRALISAGDRLAAFQSEEGGWRPVAGNTLGSPITWGAPLATVMSRDALRRIDPERYGAAIALAGGWLEQQDPQRTVDLAAVVLSLQKVNEATARARREALVERLLAAQQEDGGWGPYRLSQSEAFDTAIAVQALAAVAEEEAPERTETLTSAIGRGREWLISEQQPDGSWVETTRPGGATSLAHRVSTTAWCLEALVVK